MRSRISKISRVQYVANIETIVNTRIFAKNNGKEKGTWTFPVNADISAVTDISEKNENARLLVSNLELLLPTIFEYHAFEDARDWEEALHKYRDCMETLRSRKPFKKRDVLHFQSIADKFGDMWVKIAGRDGQSNYMHDLISGHCSYFLFKYGSLYRFSQQGWEALMKKMKGTFHFATQKGGGTGKVRSKILPICEYLLRELFWRFGDADHFFKEMVYPRNGELPNLLYGSKRRPEEVDEKELMELARSFVDIYDTHDNEMNDNEAPECFYDNNDHVDVFGAFMEDTERYAQVEKDAVEI